MDAQARRLSKWLEQEAKREVTLAWQKNYRDTHPEKKVAIKEWRKNNPDKVRGYTVSRYKKHGEKIKKAQRANYKLNRERILERAWRYRLKKDYGITPEQWHFMLVDQAGRCWLCGQPMMEKYPAVDHDHKTNRVRGLAHIACNLAFGLLKEDPTLLEALASKAKDLKTPMKMII